MGEDRGDGEKLLGSLPSITPTTLGHDFVLAVRGLRRLHGRGEGFLGYSAGEMFWKDVLGLVHEDDLPYVWVLISNAIQSLGDASLTARFLLRDKSGEWRLAEFTFRNVPEVPGDPGLVVANVSAAQTFATNE